MVGAKRLGFLTGWQDLQDGKGEDEDGGSETSPLPVRRWGDANLSGARDGFGLFAEFAIIVLFFIRVLKHSFRKRAAHGTDDFAVFAKKLPTVRTIFGLRISDCGLKGAGGRFL